MDIGIIGLGKMGKNVAQNMMKNGYKVHAYNRTESVTDEVVAKGAKKVKEIEEFREQLARPRIIWVMLPSGDATEDMLRNLSSILEEGDIVIDGSNSFYKDSIRMHAMLREKGIMFLDAGCSGGPSGALNGMSIMVGGEESAFRKMEELFKYLSVPNGYIYVGAPGSGHFVKMVHNAIEYGMMEAIAEGMDLVKNGPYKDIDLAGLCNAWNNGSVIEGRLIKLTQSALSKDGKLEKIVPYVEDTGEGRWSVQAAIEHGILFTAIASSLFERFSSRDSERFGKKLLAALRHEFGGHAVKEE
jgi:6-phosphogluconate dehydrogenase